MLPISKVIINAKCNVCYLETKLDVTNCDFSKPEISVNCEHCDSPVILCVSVLDDNMKRYVTLYDGLDKRITKADMIAALETNHIKELLETGSWIGCVSWRVSRSIINTVTVDLDDRSHRIIECHWDGDMLKGTIEILDSKMGKFLKDNFGLLKFTPRMLKGPGVNNLLLITFDIVKDFTVNI